MLIDYLKKNRDILLYTLRWVFYWEFIMGFYSIVLKSIGVNHLNNYGVTIAYFASASVLSLFIFNTFKRKPVKNVFNHQQATYLLASFFIFCFIIPSLQHYVPLSQENKNFLLNMKFYYPLLQYNTSATKILDIIFQQTLIYSILLYLNEKISSRREIISIFTLCFAIIHVPLFIFFGWMSLTFTIPSIFAGIIFSYLILSFENGLFYSFLVHQMFYLVVAFVMRMSW